MPATGELVPVNYVQAYLNSQELVPHTHQQDHGEYVDQLTGETVGQTAVEKRRESLARQYETEEDKVAVESARAAVQRCYM